MTEKNSITLPKWNIIWKGISERLWATMMPPFCWQRQHFRHPFTWVRITLETGVSNSIGPMGQRRGAGLDQMSSMWLTLPAGSGPTTPSLCKIQPTWCLLQMTWDLMGRGLVQRRLANAMQQTQQHGHLTATTVMNNGAIGFFLLGLYHSGSPPSAWLQQQWQATVSGFFLRYYWGSSAVAVASSPVPSTVQAAAAWTWSPVHQDLWNPHLWFLLMPHSHPQIQGPWDHAAIVLSWGPYVLEHIKPCRSPSWMAHMVFAHPHALGSVKTLCAIQLGSTPGFIHLGAWGLQG